MPPTDTDIYPGQHNHDYAGVSPDIMWDTALTDIPKLLADLRVIKSK